MDCFVRHGSRQMVLRRGLFGRWVLLIRTSVPAPPDGSPQWGRWRNPTDHEAAQVSAVLLRMTGN